LFFKLLFVCFSGGHAAFIPKKDSFFQNRRKLLANIDVYMGGRAAEELVLGKENITGGASHDLQQATRIGNY
jgi:ATP-dependent metalloprotease